MARLLETYGEPITLINRLDAKHAALKEDVYYVTVIHGCMWSESSEVSTSSSGTVVPSTLHKVQIPAGSETFYEKYRDWRELDSREGTFTLRNGDYVIRGIVDEPVTAATVRTIVSDYEPDVFQVRAWRPLTVLDETPDGLTYAFALEG